MNKVIRLAIQILKSGEPSARSALCQAMNQLGMKRRHISRAGHRYMISKVQVHQVHLVNPLLGGE